MEEQKKELHLLIDSSASNIIKGLANIFEALKFDDSNVQKSGNIEINENMDSLANEINTLLNIVYKMKIREIQNQNEKPKISLSEKRKDIIDSLKKLTEVNENIENHLSEMKRLPFVNMLKYLPLDKPINQKPK